MESENAIVLVPEADNEHIKLIELNELKLKSPDYYFPETVKVNGEQIMIIKSPLQSSNRYEEFYKFRTTVPLLRYDDATSLAEVRCLVCYENVSTMSDDCLLNVFKSNNNAKYSETNLTAILSDILQKEITKENTHSEYICNSCYQLLNEWNKLSSRLKTIERILIAMFQETCESLKAAQEIQDSRIEEEEGSQKNESELTPTKVDVSSFRIRTKRKTARLESQMKKVGVGSEQKLCSEPALEDLKSTIFSREETLFEDRHAKDDERNVEDEKLSRTSEALKYEMNDPFSSVRENTQSCDSCSFQSSSAAELTKHRKSHFCRICGLFLCYPAQMKTHLVKVHNFSKQSVNQFKLFHCFYCSKKYSSKGSLRNHKKTIHNESKFVCEVCGLAFRHSRLLAIHRIRHQGKKIRCTECHTSFFFASELNRHINQVHRKVRPYECPKCGHYFCQRSTLTHHLSQHTNHEGQAETETREQSRNDGSTLVAYGISKKTIDSKKDPTGSFVGLQENDTPYVSLEFDLTHQNSGFEDERDEIEINLNFENPANANSSIGSSMSAYSNQCLDVNSLSFPAESGSTSRVHSPIVIPSSFNQALLRLETGSKEYHRVKYQNLMFFTQQDLLFNDSIN